MTKLNQIIAVEKGVKSRSERELTEAHHGLKKADLIGGITRTYAPLADDGERFPDEVKRVQVHVEDVVASTASILVDLFDITATKDFANTHALADVVVDGTVLVAQAPVTYLLWLEKRLTLIHEFVKELPVLSDDAEWNKDANGVWATPAEKTHKTKKLPRAFEKAAATDKHPAQVETVYEDMVVGYWTTTKRSGAVPATRVRTLVQRVEKLQRAVKMAREEANSAEATPVHVGAKITDYLFAP